MLRITWFVSSLAILGLTLYWLMTDEHGDSAGNSDSRSIARILSQDGDAGFRHAGEPRAFAFPRDHGPHPQYKHEWWYITGNLRTDAGRHFGFQLTFFRFGLKPGTAKRASSWGTNQLYMAHFTLSDVTDGKFHGFERVSRAAAGLAGATAEPFRVWLEDWFLEGVGGMPIETMPSLRLHARGEGVVIDLVAESDKPIVLQGERGLSRKSATPGNASYYYSATRLRTGGMIHIGTQAFNVKGDSWMDREWSTSALDSDQAGWDWFALQLSDGRELMFYQLRRRDGTAHPFSQGMLVAADALVRRLTLADVKLEIRDYWKSTQTGIRYPSRWVLTLANDGTQLEIEPYLADQELDFSVRYWEGAVRATGTRNGAPISGDGYVELVGYGR